ncbi:hypothetical protein A3A67_04340 [Candidatus Peribacteria bacterium RIFCSPLOWO2_01_FULL_51_18]|nr:MAG: hypothetical protein A3A67_04340 [Candidatus Peribacteria bacterium RIFCSPLOWO2_01_FULL_51_18]
MRAFSTSIDSYQKKVHGTSLANRSFSAPDGMWSCLESQFHVSSKGEKLMDNLFLSLKLVPRWMWWPAAICVAGGLFQGWIMLAFYARIKRLRREAKAFAWDHGFKDLTDQPMAGAGLYWTSDSISVRKLGKPADSVKGSALENEYLELLLALKNSLSGNSDTYRWALLLIQFCI